MKNITVSVDEETYRLSRIKAAEAGTSVSALVRGFLRSLAGSQQMESELERRRRLLKQITAEFEEQGVGLRMAENIARGELYERDALR